jgi:hypothetical protein
MEKSAQNIDFTEGAIGKKLFLFVLPFLQGIYCSNCTQRQMPSLSENTREKSA